MRNERFSLLNKLKDIMCGHVRKVVMLSSIFGQYILTIWLEIIKTYCRYSNGTNCAPLVADLLLFCYERDFILSLSDNNQVNDAEAFNSIPQD